MTADDARLTAALKELVKTTAALAYLQHQIAALSALDTPIHPQTLAALVLGQRRSET